MQPYLVVVLACAGLFAAGAVVLTRRSRREGARREGFLLFATAHGWRYHVTKPWTRRWDGGPFNASTTTARVENVIEGELDHRPFFAFEYAYDSSDQLRLATLGGDAQVKRFAVVVLSTLAYLPVVEVTPERRARRLAGAAGLAPDVELESEEFNRAYRVSATDPRTASDLLTPRLMELLLRRPGAALRIDGADAIVWREGPMTASGVLEDLAFLRQVLAVVPTHVWRDHGSVTP